MATTTVWVLLKETGDDTTVHSVHATHVLMLARIERIKKANPQYEMERLSGDYWRIGPDEDEDEGFFGNKPVYLRAIEKPFTQETT